MVRKMREEQETARRKRTGKFVQLAELQVLFAKDIFEENAFFDCNTKLAQGNDQERVNNSCKRGSNFTLCFHSLRVIS